MRKVSLDEWNYQYMMLTQSLIGSISSNFRLVSLKREDGSWKILFILECNDEQDMEEIEDEIMFSFEKYQYDNALYGTNEFSYDVRVSREPINISLQHNDEWVVFYRRENH